LPLTLDASRAPVLASLRAGEQEFRSQLVKRLKESGASSPPGANLKSTRRISPFAAIVFSRAQPRRDRIVPEMERLRVDLTDTRKKMQHVEGVAHRKDINEQAAKEELQRALAEIKRHFGTRGHLVRMQEVDAFATDALEVAATPFDPKASVKALLGAPLQVLQRFLAQRTLASTHKFRDELPGSAALRHAVYALFGDLARYGEPVD
jgi:hypothetical protein